MDVKKTLYFTPVTPTNFSQSAYTSYGAPYENGNKCVCGNTVFEP